MGGVRGLVHDLVLALRSIAADEYELVILHAHGRSQSALGWTRSVTSETCNSTVIVT